MKEIDENLACKFGDIADLPVSEELLGAYLEGNLDGIDAATVEDAISEASDLEDLVDGVSDVDDLVADMDGLDSEDYNVVDFVPFELPSWEPWSEYSYVAAGCPDDDFDDDIDVSVHTDFDNDEDDVYDNSDTDDFNQTLEIDDYE